MASINKRLVKIGVRYDLRYRVNGRQREKSFTRKVGAVKFRATAEADLAGGDWIDVRKSKQTVAEFAERWFATLGGHRASTRSRYRPSSIDTSCLSSVTSRSRESTITPSRCGSLSSHRNALSQMCGSAIRAGAMRSNPS